MIEFEVLYKGRIEVIYNSQLFLYADIDNKFFLKMNFYKDQKLILKSRAFPFMLWKNIKIVYQDLPMEITLFQRNKLFEYQMNFGNYSIISVLKNFSLTSFRFYSDNIEIARVEDYKGVTFGMQKSKLITIYDDDIMNTYILLLYLMQLLP